MMLLLLVIAQVTSERIHVVTPENEHAGVVNELNNGGNVTDDESDSYVKAYNELRNIAERRNPIGSYVDDHPYNTVVHSSYIDEDVYPEFSYKTHPHKHHRYHPSFSVMYGHAAPVSYYHHHHQQEIPVHHSSVDFSVSSPIHFLSAFLAKYGLKKIFKLIAKIAVLKIILKFVAIIALFFVLPSLMPQEKDKEETEDDRLLDNLNDVTNWVWNGIEGKEKMDDDEEEEENNHDDSDKDKDKDKEKEKEKEKHKDKDDGELDETDLELLNKIIKEWKEENFGGPDKGSAVHLLLHCVNTVNRILGVMLAYIKAKHGNMDVLDSMMLDRFSIYMKNVVKMWPKITAGFAG